MGVPQQIRAQQAVADEFDRQAREGGEPNPETPPASETPPAAPPAPAPAPVPPAPPADDAALWRQRFLSLQGMFNTQVPSLQQQVKDLKAEIEDVRKERESKPAPAAPTPATLTHDDVTAFGSDLVDMVRRGAREEIAKVTAAYEAKVKTLEGALQEATRGVSQVAQEQTKSQQQVFFERLASRLPQWEAVQNTAECQAWLGQRMPGLPHTWNDALVAAASNHNVDGVLEVFGEFFRNHPGARPNAQPAPKPAPRNQAELERQVAPPRSGATPPPPSASKRTYSAAQYSEESMKVIRFAQRGRHAEASALEAELNAALAEGRVNP